MLTDSKTLDLFQYKDGYRYNSDSMLLYDFICSFKPKGKVLDVGSGSGILGLLIKRDFPDISLSQIDVQKEHFLLTQKSAQANDIESEVLLGDFLDFTFQSPFDTVISNPPFYHKGAQKSKSKALHVSRHSDALPFEFFVKKVKKILSPRGEFFFCYDAKQLDIVLMQLHTNKLKAKTIRFVHRKKDDDATLVLIHAQKGSNALCKILNPLYMYNDEGILHKHIAGIYEKSNTQSQVWQK